MKVKIEEEVKSPSQPQIGDQENLAEPIQMIEEGKDDEMIISDPNGGIKMPFSLPREIILHLNMIELLID